MATLSATQSRFIFSADPEFFDTALVELRQADKNLKLEEELTSGVGLISSGLDELSFFTIMDLAQPVFVRQLVPVQAQITLDNDPSDLNKFVPPLFKLPSLSLIKKKTAFACQVRLLSPQSEDKEVEGKALSHNNPKEVSEGEALSYDSGRGGKAIEGEALSYNKQNRPYTPFAVKEKIVEAVTGNTGGLENIKAPTIVISVVCAGDKAYFGISSAAQNLSSWPGGERRFARVPAMISRAEFKLLEALEFFGLTLPKRGTALDLGAAPGGWTRLLLENGLRVVAVDPAEMHLDLKGNPRLEHYRGGAEPFLADAMSHNRIFDIVCNDMRMDARHAARLMLQAADLLSPSGFALTSLKLPHATSGMQPLRVMNEALEILGVGYEEVRARQLFHNRQEVTVCLKK